MATHKTSDLRTRHTSAGVAAPVSNPWLQGASDSSGGGSAWSSSGAQAFQSSPGSFGGSSTFGSDGSAGGSGFEDRTSGGGKGDKQPMSPELKMTFGLIILTAICLHADQNLSAPNLSAIADDFEMTPLQKDTRLGGMVQFGFFLIGGAVSLLAGPLTDQVDRVTMLSCVVLSGCVPSLLMSMFVPASKAGFVYYLLARICTGIAIGGSFPVLFSLTSDLFPASQRTFVSTAISASCNIGAAVGGLMAGIIGPRFGWRVPFQIVAVPSLVCAVGVRVFLVDPRAVQRRKASREESGMSNPWMGGREPAEGVMSMEDLDFTKFRRVLAVRSNMLVFAQSLPGCIPLSCITTFLSDYLSVEQGMQVGASTAVTAIFGVSCLCCALGGGWLGQKCWNGKKENLALLMCAATSLAPLPFIALVNAPRDLVTTSTGKPSGLALFIAMLGGVAGVTGPNVRAILMNVNDSDVRGTAFSAFTLTDDLGKGLGPSIIVVFTAMFGRRFAYTLAFALWWVSGAILLCLRVSLPRDAARHGGSLLPMKSK